jgi:hypothetical protein
MWDQLKHYTEYVWVLSAMFINKSSHFYKDGTVNTYFREWKDTQGPQKTTCVLHVTCRAQVGHLWSYLLNYLTLPPTPNPNPNNVWQPHKMTGTIIHLHIQLFSVLEMVIINWITSSVSFFFSPNGNTNLFYICYCCSQTDLETYSNDLLCITFFQILGSINLSVNINPLMKKHKNSCCINWIWLPVIFLVVEALVEKLSQ